MKYGLQLYSLRDDTKADHLGTLKKVAEMGYENIEFAGYYDMSGKEMKNYLDSLGLKAISSHVGYGRFQNNFKEEVEFNHAVGNDTIVLPWFKLTTLEEAKAAVDQIGEMAEAFIKEGFNFGYHNHAFEFAALDEKGTCAMDYIRTIQNVKLQPDVFWVKTAGVDPIEFIKANSGKILAIHMKEYRSDGFNVEFGNGVLPWREIMAEAEKAGATMGIIEQEEYTCPPIESVEIGLKNLKKIFN